MHFFICTCNSSATYVGSLRYQPTQRGAKFEQQKLRHLRYQNTDDIFLIKKTNTWEQTPFSISVELQFAVRKETGQSLVQILSSTRKYQWGAGMC